MYLTKDQIIIPEEKIKGYLLVFMERNDKSGFLKELGFTQENWYDLVLEIVELATTNELIHQKKSVFGDLYSITGRLRGFSTVTIWFHIVQLNQFRFVTLFPHK